MNNKTLNALRALDGCQEGVRWAAKQKTAQQAWDACKRADWMTWLLAKTCALGQQRHKRLVALSCRIARDALSRQRAYYDQHTLESARDNIRFAEGWVVGRRTRTKLRVNAYNVTLSGDHFSRCVLLTVSDLSFAPHVVTIIADTDASMTCVGYGTTWMQSLERYAGWVRKEFPKPPRLKGKHK